MTCLSRHPVLAAALDAVLLAASVPAIVAVVAMLALAPRLLQRRTTRC